MLLHGQRPNPRRWSKAMKEHREIWIGFVEDPDAISYDPTHQAASRERVPGHVREIQRRFSLHLVRGDRFLSSNLAAATHE
jgi:hypothetical protein